jgi:hypothetical protein
MYTVMTSVAGAASDSDLIAVALLRPEKSNPHSREPTPACKLRPRNVVPAPGGAEWGVQELDSGWEALDRLGGQPRQRESLSFR